MNLLINCAGSINVLNVHQIVFNCNSRVWKETDLLETNKVFRIIYLSHYKK